MRIGQAPVTPTPTGINLKGQTAIVTGASAGIGQETARQLLTLNIGMLILAVRNVTKGEEVKQLLLADPAVRTHNQSKAVRVMKVDMDDYQSVHGFALAVKSEIPLLDILVLNAGIDTMKLEVSPTGHERITQVNYLSNALLILELLPHLEATATKTGSPSRITWLGSRRQDMISLPSLRKVKPNSSVLAHFDDKANFLPFFRYGDTKCLCTMFLYELAKRVPDDKVVMNMLCPGMVYTTMGYFLPFPLRIVYHVINLLFARSLEEGAWMVINCAAVVGPESHGKYLLDKEIQP